METSESLSIESFSYSWLVNLKPSFESPKGSFRVSFEAFDESNFIEMDPKLSASKRFLVFHQDFDFDLPTLQPCVHADELISNGILVTLFLKPLEFMIPIPILIQLQPRPCVQSPSRTLVPIVEVVLYLLEGIKIAEKSYSKVFAFA
ncbi:hypothetical protein L1987_43517 [Smallanthus sonchifolius]|uniref:Uncharacterized protein n=1 Tax=Smallanthus sonchifolius TaxID=185202 RepID=A0ACB9GLM8_9ASTR|nr:hypothetical protein L1987_43517 [Smallanthus sonchifolius]